MFEGLQKKWKVSGWRLALILTTFAIGGSLTGIVAKKIMPVISIQTTWLWILIYILLVTIIWPIAVLLVSIPFGQFNFFRKYISKMGRRMGIGPRLKTQDSRLRTKIAIFASGAGSNAQRIIDHFRQHPSIVVSLIICNRPTAGVLKIASNEGIPSLMIEKERFFNGDAYLPELKQHGINLVVLAGFLWKVPSKLIKEFPGKIVNIHPALLPKYGGKGMYGQAVHEAVIAAGEKESGITIHYVDEHYDHGQTIFQEKCEVMTGDTAESLANRIHVLEHEHYPKVIERLVNQS